MSDDADAPERLNLGRLDSIETSWSLLRLAHAPEASQAESARAALVLRYSAAVERFVRLLVRDEHDAQDLAQEVLVRLLRGDFEGADPARGRFRDFLKTAVRNQVRSFFRRTKTQSKLKEKVAGFLEEGDGGGTFEETWNESWRQSLLEIAWRKLEAVERKSAGSVPHTLLRLRIDEPELDSPALARRLSELVGKEIKPEAARQQLRRARLRFAEILAEEVAKGLETPDPASLREELAAVGLLSYVEDFLPAA